MQMGLSQHWVTTSQVLLWPYLQELPVDVKIGKMIIYGTILECVESVLVIAGAISSQTPFVSPLEKREEADAAKVLERWRY